MVDDLKDEAHRESNAVRDELERVNSELAEKASTVNLIEQRKALEEVLDKKVDF